LGAVSEISWTLGLSRLGLYAIIYEEKSSPAVLGDRWFIILAGGRKYGRRHFLCRRHDKCAVLANPDIGEQDVKC